MRGYKIHGSSSDEAEFSPFLGCLNEKYHSFDIFLLRFNSIARASGKLFSGSRRSEGILGPMSITGKLTLNLFV